MNLLEMSHIIKMSGKVQKTDIVVSRVDAEKIIMLLCSPSKPQFILVDGSLLNTSFIIGVIEEVNTKSLLYASENQRELTEDEKLIHQKYLEHINNIKLLK